MMRGTFALCLAAALSLLCLAVNSNGLPPLQPIQAELTYPASFDTFDDTVRYDDGEVQWWFGGLNNFYLITRFTAPAEFALQRVVVALTNSNTSDSIHLWLKEDMSGFPGQVLWSGALLYDSPQTWLGVTINNGYAFTFDAGESFWLELFSPGPPYECYDESQLQPPRSFTNSSTPSPGDNFIRAVGEYTSAMVDVGLDSVWHGGLFFVPDGGAFPLEAHVHNYGSQTAQFAVSCSLFSALGEPEDLVGSLNVTLAAGDSDMISFPPYNLAMEGPHIFRFRTELAGDLNPYNDVMEIETQIYHIPPAAELSYDDGIPMGAVTTPMMGDGWGMRFDPEQPGYYRVTGVEVCVDTTSGNRSALIQVLAENPTNLSPGAVLWETVQTLHNGWNSLPVQVTTSGVFYVAYLFENGNSSPALNYDHFPLSGQCWSKMSGVWIKGECLEEWMLRAVIDTSSASGGPQLWITLTPNGSTIIPAGGDTLFYELSAGNSGTVADAADFWLYAILPSGSNYGPILGPLYDFPLPAGYAISRDKIVIVPASAPAGSYHLVACLGEYTPPNNIVIASDSLAFAKAGHHGGGGAFWLADGGGAPFGAAAIEALPQDQRLMQFFPNPFNAVTAIQLHLPESGLISLLIYDLLGRPVASLLENAWLLAGDHEVAFDGRDLPSGIYVGRMAAGRHSASEKILLLK